MRKQTAKHASYAEELFYSLATELVTKVWEPQGVCGFKKKKCYYNSEHYNHFIYRRYCIQY